MNRFSNRALYCLPKLAALSAFFLGSPARAILSFQTTLSSGFYRDPNQNSHVPTLFNWDMTHTAQNGVETNLSLGVNNTLVTNTWSFSVYQATVQIPLSEKHEFQGTNQSVLSVGRSFLTSGFEIGALDGAQGNLSFSKDAGMTFAGGTLASLDNPNSAFQSLILGGAAHSTWGGLLTEGGYYEKKRDTLHAHLLHASLQTSFEETYLKPQVLVRAQWNLPSPSLNQFLGELSLFPSDEMATVVSYSTRQPNALDPGDGSWIYQLFALSTQECMAASLSWGFHDTQHFELRAERASFRSNNGPETGYQMQVSYQVKGARSVWTPSASYLQSYGGKAYQLGLQASHKITTHTAARGSFDLAHVDKINGINGMAYDARGGLRFQIGPNLFAQALMELERNHLFNFDARFVVYVSHFYF